MRRFFLPCLFLVSLSGFALGQTPLTLQLLNGQLQLQQNGATFAMHHGPMPDQLFGGRYYLVVQFGSIPTQENREALERGGVRLLDYLPENAYIASIPKNYDLSQLTQKGAQCFWVPDERVVYSPELYTRKFPPHAMVGNKIEVVVKPYSDIPKTEIEGILGRNFELVNEFPHPYLVRLRVEAADLDRLLRFPFIQYVEPIAPSPTPDDTEGRSLHRSNAINTQYSAGRHYDGTGMTVGLADDGTLGPHIDQTGRLTQFATANSGNHGDMTSGIFFGAGNREPKIQGHAPGAMAYYWDISGYTHIVGAVAHWNSYGVILTSTSYSQGTGGVYTADAQFIDNQINSNKQLEHMFSAGNAGSSDGGYGAGAGWGNITGGYKASKSVITCGDLNSSGVLESTSSRGPARDGRIKPDICANGFGQLSTDENNTTQTGSGTSAACPSVAGTVTQIYHAYKTLNGGQNPQSGLIKACILNSGDDLGNAGPDYKHGWGQINALRAVRTLEQNRYLVDSVSQGQTRTHTINIPANTYEVRVMVYWTDFPGNPSANKALVNDLNIQLTAGSVYNPWVLDATPNATNLNTPATRGIDDLNNMEQVTLTNPPSGNATLSVNGFAVPQGPQRYWVVYEFLQTGVELTYPIGGEGFVPGETEKIRWDAVDPTGNFTLEYTTNNGGTWTNISTSIASTSRFFNWNVPVAITGQAKMRITNNGNTDESDATFTIAKLPTNITINYICPDSIGISWTAATSATGYEVSILGNKYMDSVATSTTTSAVIRNQNPGIGHWYSVRALQGTGKGRRAIAVYHAGGTLNCTVPIDISTTTINSPGSGALVNCQASATTPVEVEITNTGTTSASNIGISYRFDGGAVFTETFAGPLAAGATAVHTFATTVNLSGSGNYPLKAWCTLVNDGNHYNDTLNQSTTILNGATVTLPIAENFETMAACGLTNDCGVTVCNLSNGWMNETNGSQDDIDWRVNSGSTPSTATGPDLDHNPGNSAGKYVYLEASTCYGATAQLLSPCIDLTTSQAPQLSFWYHMYGAAMGSLHVDVVAEGIWSMDVMPPISGNQTNQWRLATVNLTPFLGKVINVRFRGITGAAVTSDMALDDIGVIDANTPPVAAFSGSPLSTCPGNTVTFTDLSQNNPTSWAWTITPNTFNYANGTNAGTQNPQVQFTAAGTYSVSLTATNAFGNQAVTQSNYVSISTGMVPNIVEDFEGNFTPSAWLVLNSGGAYTWMQSVAVTGITGAPSKAAYMENFSYNNPGAEDKLLTLPIDLTSNSVASMTFDLAYSRFSATLYETLRIEVSTDCGQTFGNVVYNKGSSVLATAPDASGNWFPNAAAQWRTETVDLTPFVGQTIVVQFVNVNGYGNNMFIDNVNILNTVGLEHTMSMHSAQVWPNPTNGLFNVGIPEMPTGEIKLSIADLAGRQVYGSTIIGDGAAWQGRLDLRNLSRGVYYLRIEGEAIHFVKKIVIE
jgi:PKD repeat protein